jgi:hypothetical protein
MGRLLVRKLRIALSLLEDMALEPPKVRPARCLINLFEGYGERRAEPSRRVRVSQERLGMMLSLSRQTVNELLSQMEQEKIIQCQRGGVRVLDPAGSESRRNLRHKLVWISTCRSLPGHRRARARYAGYRAALFRHMPYSYHPWR